MRTYENNQELIAEIKKRYEKYDVEFEQVSETLKDKGIEEVDKTPSENLSYQLGWVNLILQWEKEEQAGKIVETPAPGYKWVHINTVAPFTNFRTKIRKWKKVVLTAS